MPRVCAHPADIRHLPGMSEDVRTVDKLVNGRNGSSDERDSWLAPFKNTKSMSKQMSDKDPNKREPNYICFLFDRPVAIAALELFNYSKTPDRGVNEFEVEIDGSVIFRGYANASGRSTAVFWNGSNVTKQIERLHEWINFNPSKRQNVLFMNEGKV